jgi:hypothetical protein
MLQTLVEYLPTAENILPHKFQKENNTPSHGLSSLRQILNTQCGLMRYQAAKYSAFSLVYIK